MCAEHHQKEDHRRPDREAGHWERNLEENQRGLVADPEEDRTARTPHLAQRVRRRTLLLPTALEGSFSTWCMSFDLEFWSDGDDRHSLARRGHAMRRHGTQSATGSGAAGGGRAIGALLVPGQRKV